MSCSWDIACRTCAGPQATRAGFDLNHGDAELAVLLSQRPHLEAMGKALGGISLAGTWSFDEDAPLLKAARFFAAHTGHDVALLNEYGDWLDRCNERVVCGSCGHYDKCQKKKGHAGEHLK